jgi:hypothetical protein
MAWLAYACSIYAGFGVYARFVPLGVPLMALYMQPVRVYKVFLAFYSKSKCWTLRASGILRAGFFLGRNRVGKNRGPRGHTLVTRHGPDSRLGM